MRANPQIYFDVTYTDLVDGEVVGSFHYDGSEDNIHPKKFVYQKGKKSWEISECKLNGRIFDQVYGLAWRMLPGEIEDWHAGYADYQYEQMKDRRF